MQLICSSDSKFGQIVVVLLDRVGSWMIFQLQMLGIQLDCGITDVILKPLLVASTVTMLKERWKVPLTCLRAILARKSRPA